MANSNVPQDKRKAKLKRRRREIDRMIEKMAAAGLFQEKARAEGQQMGIEYVTTDVVIAAVR